MRFGEGKYWRKCLNKYQGFILVPCFPLEGSGARNQTFTVLYSLQWPFSNGSFYIGLSSWCKLLLSISKQKPVAPVRLGLHVLPVIIKEAGSQLELTWVRRFSPNQMKTPTVPLALGSLEEPGQRKSPFLSCPPSQQVEESFTPLSSTIRERGGGSRSAWEQLLDETHCRTKLHCFVGYKAQNMLLINHEITNIKQLYRATGHQIQS